jgi:hypothetical protein
MERRQPEVGDTVYASDGQVGTVAGVIESEAPAARYIVVATGRFLRRYPVVHCGLIAQVGDGVVRVRGDRRRLRRLPEALPLVV